MKSVEGWKTESLGYVAQITMGQSPDSKFYSEEENGLPFLQGCAEFEGRFPKHSLYCSQTKKVANAGSILFSVRAPVGKINIADRDYIIGRGLAAISGKDIEQPYLEHLLIFVEPKFRSASQGSTFEAINSSELIGWPIEFPTSKPEQAKIAKVLSTVDRAIEQTEALIAKQQRIKTGLMQDLLTRGIDEHGNLRSEKSHKFKNSPLGMIPTEWEVDTFGNRVDLIHGHQFRKYDFTEAGLPVVKIGQVTEKGLNISECSYVSQARQNEFSAYRIEEGDVLMALTGATLGKVCRVSSDFRSIFLLQNYRVGKFEPKLPKDIDKTYLYFLLQTNRLLNQVFQRVNAGAQGNVGKADFEKAIIFVPGFKEQQKAGMLLLLNDRKRAQLDANLIKLNSVKTALMQDLLTGKKRITPVLEKVPKL
jgi:type I restriction enzyme, S subunit